MTTTYFGGPLSRVVKEGDKIYQGLHYTSNKGVVSENLSKAIESSMNENFEEITANCPIGNNEGIAYATNVTATKISRDKYKISISISGEISPHGLTPFSHPNERTFVVEKIKRLFEERSLPNPEIENESDKIVVNLVVDRDFKNMNGCFVALVVALV